MANMREGKNNLTIVGTLKGKKIESVGASYTKMTLVVVSTVEDKKMQNTIEFFGGNTSKLIKGWKTVMNEYKTLDDDGELADKVQIRGAIGVDLYVKDGELRKITKNKGLYCNRVEKDTQDLVGAEVEGVVSGTRPEIGKDGTPTGRSLVNVILVGYENRITELEGLIVSKENSAPFGKGFPNGTTATFDVDIKKFAVVREESVQPAQAGAFGAKNEALINIVTDYFNEMELTYGVPSSVLARYSNEDMVEMKKLKELAIEEAMKKKVKATPPQERAGFEVNTEKNDDMMPIDDGDCPF